MVIICDNIYSFIYVSAAILLRSILGVKVVLYVMQDATPFEETLHEEPWLLYLSLRERNLYPEPMSEIPDSPRQCLSTVVPYCPY